MKKYFIILFCLLLIACSKEIIITEEELKQDLLYLTDDIKPFSGTCKVLFTDTALLKEKFEFVDGTMDGKCCSYYEDGTLKWKGTYKNGRISGKWEFWDIHGNKYCEVYFKNDIYNGLYKTWYANGELKESGQYANNRKAGKWTIYDEKGNVINDSVY